ncbi:cytochrome b [Rhizobium sp. RAF56]|uniref:cytochrome b n=1 Tax=Rhizobium sp. RAF56 TaxID=3233062 RepID=UPI003F9E447E
MQKEALVAYSVPQRLLHWLTACLVFFNLLLPDGMNAWRRSVRQTGSATADQISSANIHAYVGIAILLLVAIRLWFRMFQGAPASPPQEPAFFRLVAKIAHAALYFLLIALPLSGGAAYYWGYRAAGDLHADILKVILWVMITAHILGALVHQFYWKTNLLRRMTVG